MYLTHPLTAASEPLMDDTHLRALLQEHLQAHVRFSHYRFKLLARLLLAIVQLATVNLTRLALLLPATIPANYRRLQRFFAQATLPQQAIAAMMVHWLPPGKSFIIAIDRTEWHFGKTPINILLASLVYDGTAFPLVWILLGKAGSSHQAEQRAILRKLFLVLSPARIRLVLADREFICSAFLGYLTHHGVGYGIRIRKNALVEHNGRSLPAEALFADLAVGQHRRLRRRRTIYGRQVWLYGLRLADGPKGERRLLLVAGTVRRLLRLYRLRWGIEVLFAGLKSRGFDFETTHLRHGRRLSLLVGVLALAYGLAHATGRYVSRHQPLRLKGHGRRAQSVFRLGLDRLRQVLSQGMEAAWYALLEVWSRGSIGPAAPPI